MFRKLAFFKCFSETAAAFRERLAQEIESGRLFKEPTTLQLLHELHARNRRRSFFYRLVDRPWLLPLSSFLELCQRASDQIAEHGLFTGCRMEVERFRIRLEIDVSDEAKQVFASNEPVLFVGDHPCIWGPDFWSIAASLEKLCPRRKGLLLLTWTVVTAICPGLAPYSVPVVVTARDIERFTHDETGVADNRPAGADALFRAWSADIPVARSREQTYAALEDMARRWVGGEHALIFPTGGAGTKARWFSGVGRVARFAAEMLDESAPTDPQIMFFHLKGATDFLLLSPPLISRCSPARLVGLLFRRRIAIRYGRTLRFRDWREKFASMTNREVARWLQGQFEADKSQASDVPPSKAKPANL